MIASNSYILAHAVVHVQERPFRIHSAAVNAHAVQSDRNGTHLELDVGCGGGDDGLGRNLNRLSLIGRLGTGSLLAHPTAAGESRLARTDGVVIWAAGGRDGAQRLSVGCRNGFRVRSGAAAVVAAVGNGISAAVAAAAAAAWRWASSRRLRMCRYRKDRDEEDFFRHFDSVLPAHTRVLSNTVLGSSKNLSPRPNETKNSL